MGNQKLRSINEVNGWKVNHPHSAANNFYAIFTVIFSAFPLCILFIPLYSAAVPPDFSTGLNGLDIFRYTIDKLTELFTTLFTGAPGVPAQNAYIDGIVSLMPADNAAMSQAIVYTFVAIGVLLAIIMVLSVVLIILSIVHLAKGYLKSSAAVKRIAITDFVFTLLIFLGMVFIFFVFRALTTSTAKDLFIWLTTIPLGASLFFAIFFASFHSNHFRDSILEKDLKLQDEEIAVDHISKVHEVNKVKYTESTTLPPNLESIGGHAFSENQNLIVANIPLNITKLGAGAFANCLNLQVVSIPNSVNEIGFNCFFNCVELERINYAGTKAEWRKIKRGSNWLAKAKTTEVVCLDGTIIVNPYH